MYFVLFVISVSHHSLSVSSVLSVQCGDCLELEPRHSSCGMKDQAKKRRGSMYLGKPYPTGPIRQSEMPPTGNLRINVGLKARLGARALYLAPEDLWPSPFRKISCRQISINSTGRN